MRTVIGVMGGGEADSATTAMARELGRLVAMRGWVLLNGGRDAGVMAASAAGAHAAGGLVIGVLPDSDTHRASPDLDVAVLTGMGDARNVVNVLSSHVVIAMRGSAGTISEVAHALRAGRPIVTLDFPLGATFAEFYSSGDIVDASDPQEAVALAAGLLGRQEGLT